MCSVCCGPLSVRILSGPRFCGAHRQPARFLRGQGSPCFEGCGCASRMLFAQDGLVGTLALGEWKAYLAREGAGRRHNRFGGSTMMWLVLAMQRWSRPIRRCRLHRQPPPSVSGDGTEASGPAGSSLSTAQATLRSRAWSRGQVAHVRDALVFVATRQIFIALWDTVQPPACLGPNAERCGSGLVDVATAPSSVLQTGEHVATSDQILLGQ